MYFKFGYISECQFSALDYVGVMDWSLKLNFCVVGILYYIEV